MGRLTARSVPLLTETLDPPLLTRIVAMLFPEGGRSVVPNVIVGDPDVIIVTAGEVRRAAKRIDLGRAPGPDGIPGLLQGFRVGHSTLGAIEKVKYYIQECACGGQVGVLTLLDISNAFNSLPYETVQGGLYCSEAQCEIPRHSFRFKYVI
ncbi:hypothetical protein M0804_015517 [Polistes exclamans]|nr:hypothetical protein M0804_015517 [Polistes exclamans]